MSELHDCRCAKCNVLYVAPERGTECNRCELTRLRIEAVAMRETLRSMASYLAHYDQDANHEWMFRTLRIAAGDSVAQHEFPTLKQHQRELLRPRLVQFGLFLVNHIALHFEPTAIYGGEDARRVLRDIDIYDLEKSVVI